MSLILNVKKCIYLNYKIKWYKQIGSPYPIYRKLKRHFLIEESNVFYLKQNVSILTICIRDYINGYMIHDHNIMY